MMKTLDQDFPLTDLPGVAAQLTDNNFAMLAAIDVSAQIEKKNNLSYLSWAWAVDRLMRADPTASWVYNEPMQFGQTLMVSCTVVAFGKPMTMQLPVMDYKNKAVPNPDSFAVNTAMQRCLVKAIALHGLGLYIYAGEDLPYEEKIVGGKPAVDDPDAPPSPEEMTNLAKDAIAIFKEGDIATTSKHILDYFTDKDGVNNDQLSTFWSYLDSESAMRSTLRAYTAIQYAATTEALDKVWARVPKHAQAALMPYFDKRKQELQPMEAAA